MTDVRDGLISHESAERIYKFVYDHENLAVDRQAAEARRQEAREERKGKSVPYD